MRWPRKPSASSWHVRRIPQADPDRLRSVHRLRGFELLPVVLFVLGRGCRMSMPDTFSAWFEALCSGSSAIRWRSRVLASIRCSWPCSSHVLGAGTLLSFRWIVGSGHCQPLQTTTAGGVGALLWCITMMKVKLFMPAVRNTDAGPWLGERLSQQGTVPGTRCDRIAYSLPPDSPLTRQGCKAALRL